MDYSLKDAAKKLNVAVITMRRWVQSGSIDYKKVGKQYRVSDEDINNFVVSQKKIPSLPDKAETIIQPRHVITLKLPKEMFSELESEMSGLSYGIVKLEVHVRDGFVHRYTIGREHSKINLDD
jgi:excisionase family DNA binding protein